MVAWWEDQTHCHAKKKTPTPSSAPRALHPNRIFPLLRVKPLPTGSGSSAPASSGRCWGSSFDGLLTSHPPSGCHCDKRQKHTVMLMLPQSSHAQTFQGFCLCICLPVCLTRHANEEKHIYNDGKMQKVPMGNLGWVHLFLFYCCIIVCSLLSAFGGTVGTN